MKPVLIICLNVLCLVASDNPQATANTPIVQFHPPECITLPTGTLVLLETAERTASDRATIGKQVLFRVRANVVVDGQVVIRTGALALGRVKSIRKNTYNFPESLVLEVTAVQTVDGRLVALHGNEQTFTGLFPGESMQVEPGQTMTASLMNNETIYLP